MKKDRRLHWVMVNRAPRGGIEPIGVLVGGLAKGTWSRDGERRAQLASILAECVDEEFRRHCRMESASDGMLAIEVDEPGLISMMRARWASKIGSALRKSGGKTGVRGVLFKFGRNGDRIPAMAGGMSDKHG